MRVGRGKASLISDLTVDSDLDFLTTYQVKQLASPASGEALRKGSAEITDTEIAAGAAIVYSKLNLALGILNGDINASAAIVESKLSLDQGTQALFDKVATDIGTHKGDVDAHHAKTVIGDLSPIALANIVNTYLLPTIMTTRGDIVYRGATYPGRVPAGTEGYILTMGANDPGWVTPIPTVPRGIIASDTLQHSNDIQRTVVSVS
ncbi:unnamed protein product, partial [marine sediment metagenome]